MSYQTKQNVLEEWRGPSVLWLMKCVFKLCRLLRSSQPVAADQTFHFKTWRSERIAALRSRAEPSYTDTQMGLASKRQQEVSRENRRRMGFYSFKTRLFQIGLGRALPGRSRLQWNISKGNCCSARDTLKCEIDILFETFNESYLEAADIFYSPAMAIQDRHMSTFGLCLLCRDSLCFYLPVSTSGRPS